MIITINSLREIIEEINSLAANDWLVVDVDYTLITFVDAIFQSNSPHRNFIDEFKSDKIFQLEDNLSKWRLLRKSQLVELEWPSVFNKIHQNKVCIYGLTQLHTGAYGVIPSMEKWRINELNSFNLKFSKHSSDDQIQELINLPNTLPATVYGGVMFTGSHKKYEVLEKFLEIHPIKPKKIIFIDDRLNQIQEMDSWLNKCHFNSICVHYKATELMEGEVSIQRNEIQIQSFLNGKWLNDKQANKVLDSNKD